MELIVDYLFAHSGEMRLIVLVGPEGAQKCAITFRALGCD